MDGGGRKVAGIALGAIIGRQMNRPAARDQLMRQRLGGKQMSAGAACREKDRAFRHPIPPEAPGGRAQ